MSESHQPGVTHPTSSLGYASPELGERPKLLRLGGSLGIAACVIGLLILVAACGGLNASLKFSFLPVLMGGVGFVLTLIGAVTEKHKYAAEDTHVLAALFACTMGIIGGVVEMAAWLKWNVFT